MSFGIHLFANDTPAIHLHSRAMLLLLHYVALVPVRSIGRRLSLTGHCQTVIVSDQIEWLSIHLVWRVGEDVTALQ